MKRTFSIDKTNPRLTGNIKCVVDENDSIFLESIDSSEFLTQAHFKGFEFNPNLSWGSNVRNFASKWSDIDEVFETVDEMSIDKNNNINTTYHQLYHKGLRSNGNALIDGKLRYFAPIHVGMAAEDRPDAFVVFAIPDTPSERNDYGSKYVDWINKGEPVKIFDLKKVNELIFSGITDSYVQFDFDEDISAVGMSLSSGLGKRAHESNGDDFLENEVTLTEWENNITNIYRRHNMVYGNIVNMEFAFDHVGDNTFKRYVGFYVRYNEVGFETLRNYDGTGAIRLLRTREGIQRFKDSDEPNTYSRVTRNAGGSTVGSHRPSTLRFRLMLNPNIGDHLYIRNGNTVEHDIRFESHIIGSTISQTSQNIVSIINTGYQGQHSSVSASYSDGWITLRSNATIVDFDGEMTVSGETYVKIEQPVWSISGSPTVNNFTVCDRRTILIDEYIDPSRFGGYIRYKDVNGIIRDSRILKVQNQGDLYLYQMEDTIDKPAQPSTFWFVDKNGDVPLLCSIIDHRELDVRQTVSDYSDVYDFNIGQFRDYLVNRINLGKELGGILSFNGYEDYSQVTQQDVEAYKEILMENVLSYFQDLDVEPRTLIGNIDLGSSNAEPIGNEYARLGEYNNEHLNRINRLYPIINKWSLDNGLDTYENPYRLNISLPFGMDNYSTNQRMDRRDIRFHTHSWYILGDGIPPYIASGDRKRLSYSRQPIDENLLMDGTMDAYSLLEHNTGKGIERGYTTIEYDPIQEKSFAFFRGLKWFFEDNTIDGYRFSVILSGSRYLVDKQYEMEFVKNDTHRTMTLMVWFYIPDPVITSLESGQGGYTVDRSLLYFSDEVLSTSEEPLDFGESPISLNLYDGTSTKNYIGSAVTNNWFYTKPNGENIIWVGRGSNTSFNTPFHNMFGLGDNFQIYFTGSDDINSPFYGMYIEFNDMAEVGADHFWCKQIIVRNNTNYDPEGDNDHDISDNIVDGVYHYDVLAEFLADPNVFNTNNTIYSSKGIAKENCSYIKIITAESNNARYKSITLPNIKNVLSLNPVPIHGSGKRILTGVVETIENSMGITLDRGSAGIEALDEPFAFPIHRYNGTYKPQTKLLYRASDSIDAENVWITRYAEPYFERLSILPNPSEIVPRTIEYRQLDIHKGHDHTYPYHVQVGENAYSTKTIGWIYNPTEHKGEPSLVFNGAPTLRFDVDGVSADLVDIMYERVYRWLGLSDRTLDDGQNLKFLNIDTKVYEQTRENYEVKKMIVRNFIGNTFVGIYHITKVLDRFGNELDWSLDGTHLTIQDPSEGGSYSVHFEK